MLWRKWMRRMRWCHVMKILHLADLHMNSNWLGWVTEEATRFDLVVLAGDLLDAFANRSMADQANAVSEWLIRVDCPVVQNFYPAHPDGTDSDRTVKLIQSFLRIVSRIADEYLTELGVKRASHYEDWFSLSEQASRFLNPVQRDERAQISNSIILHEIATHSRAVPPP